MNELKTLAKNSESIKDEFVYRGFVSDDYNDDVEYNFDETLVMLCPLGEFSGSTVNGEKIKEIIDEDSIKRMAQQSEEILLDRDHSSMRNVSERDSSAMGWISNLKAITNLGDMSGLYGVIKWTSEGIRLAKERIYRFLSPVFELDADGKVLSLLNVGLTNRPALKMMPIINSEGDSEKQISITNEEINMSKEDIKQMILETIEEVNQSKLSSDIATEEIKEEVVEETVEEKIEEPETVEETAEEIKEEVVEETVEEEVIKKESLNSMPVTVGQSIDNSQIWKKLHGQEFLDYVNKHKNELM